MRIVKIVFVAIAALGLISCASSTGPKKGASVRQMLNIATGKVTGYNWTASTITIVTGMKASLDFQIENDAKILKSGKAIKMKDIKVGNEVRMVYQIRGNKNIARTIAIEAEKK